MTGAVFTPAQIKEDGGNRVARTSAQVFASQIVTVGDWIAHQAGWHGQLPTPVAVSIAGILVVAASVIMNLGRIRGRG